MTEIVGHRGVGKAAPENTLLSFKKAIEIGCDRAELDVRMTKDNHSVIIHDETVDRVSDGHGKVSEIRLAEIIALKLDQGQKIPTLPEVIELCKGKIPLQIELKGPNTTEHVCKLVIEHDIVQETVVTSFDLERIKKIKQLNPKIVIGYLFKKLPNNIFEIAKEHAITYLCPKKDIITQEFVARCHREGHKVYVWHVNDVHVGKQLINIKVDGIGTDFPEYFL